MMSTGKRVVIISLVLVAILFALGIGLAGGVVLQRYVLSAEATQASAASANGTDFSLISEAQKIIENRYVGRSDIKPDQLTYGAITGMVESLGDTGHSRFMSPEMVQSQKIETSGEFEGIGVQVATKNGNIVVVAPFDGSPAQKAGVRSGYIFVKVNGEDVQGMTMDDLVKRVRGVPGTTVEIVFMDPETGQLYDKTIERARIQINNVTWSFIPGTKVAQLRIATFSNGVTDDLKKALKDIQSQDATGIVLDLRDNPGGLLSEAVGVASQFLTQGDVLQQKDAKGNVTTVPVESGGLAPKIPLVVLVNGGSASASEIVTGALQDAGRGQVVGEKTFGTGTVLNQFDLSDHSALLLAVEEWLTPKGRLIWHEGLEPDKVVSLPVGATAITPDLLRQMSADQFNTSQDAQLIQAVKAVLNLLAGV
jgi:carboxyl-terminal processing protease